MAKITISMAVTLMVLAVSSVVYVANAYDPAPLQDFCVGVLDPQDVGVWVNGLYCKNPKDVTANDFLYRGFDTIGDTNNEYGSKVVQVNVSTFPALNTLGVAMGRIDFRPGGLNQPHLHPRASEMLTVIEGTMYVAFVSSRQDDSTHRLYGKVLQKGDIFVFPQGLIHFQLNIGGTHAVANVAFSSQNPGFISVAGAMFGSMPPIPDDVLTKAFQVDEKATRALREQYYKDGQASLHSWI